MKNGFVLGEMGLSVFRDFLFEKIVSNEDSNVPMLLFKAQHSSIISFVSSFTFIIKYSDVFISMYEWQVRV